MSLIQAIILAALLAAAELFPVSSLGHATFLPAALGWPLDPRGAGGMRFLTVLELGTALGLLAFYRRDWAAMLGARRQLLLPLVVGTIPAAVLTVLFGSALDQAVGAPALAAMALVVNG